MFLLYGYGTFKVYKSHKSDPRSKDIDLASFCLLDALKDSVFQTLLHTSETLSYLTVMTAMQLSDSRSWIFMENTKYCKARSAPRM